MKTLFDMDNPFFSFMGKLADYVILNLLFLLTCCPVITIGAALAALHGVVPKMAEGTEGNLYRTYMQFFIRSFRKSLTTWLFLLITGGLLVFDLTIAADTLGRDVQRITIPVVSGLLFLWLLVFSWIFVLPEGLDGNVRENLRMALTVAIRRLPRTLLMIVIELIPIVFYMASMRIFAGILLPVYVCIGFSLSAALCSILAGRTVLGKGKVEEDE